MPASLLANIAFLTLGACTAADAKDLEDRKWIEVSTDHFVVYSALTEKKTVKLVKNLELMQALIPEVTNFRQFESRVPTRIIIVTNKTELKLFLDNENVAGFFLPGLRFNTIMLREIPYTDEAEIILHEYVHSLVDSQAGFQPPRWYNEGIAEYLSNSKMSSEFFDIGRPPAGAEWLRSGKWLSTEELLNSAHFNELKYDQEVMFYMQSWALMHFLISHPELGPALGSRMVTYLDYLTSDVNATEAFEKSFDIAADQLMDEVEDYVHKECCATPRYAISDLLPDFSPVSRKISKTRASLVLGQAALQVKKLEAAERWLNIAIADEETRPQAESGLAAVAAYAGNMDSSLQRLQAAEALDPDDPYIRIDAAEFWVGRSQKSESAEEKQHYLDEARRKVTEAWQLDGSIPEPYYLNGYLHQQNGEFEQAIDMFRSATALHPSNVKIRIALAEAFAQAGQMENAVHAANSLRAIGHRSGEATAIAEQILEWAEANQPPAASPD